MKSILILFFFGMSLTVFSQDNFDKRLLTKFSEEQLKEMAAEQSPVLTYWTYYLDNSYQIIDIEPGKNLDIYPEIKFKSADKFNVLEVSTRRQKAGKTHFRIKNTNKLLVLDSGDDFIKKYNAYRAKN